MRSCERILADHKKWVEAEDKTGLDHLRADLCLDLTCRANSEWPNCRGPFSRAPNCRGPTSSSAQLQGADLNGAQLQGAASGAQLQRTNSSTPNCRGPTSTRPNCREPILQRGLISAKQTLKMRTSSGWRSPRTESRDRSALLTSPMQISATPT